MSQGPKRPKAWKVLVCLGGLAVLFAACFVRPISSGMRAAEFEGLRAWDAIRIGTYDYCIVIATNNRSKVTITADSMYHQIVKLPSWLGGTGTPARMRAWFAVGTPTGFSTYAFQ